MRDLSEGLAKIGGLGQQHAKQPPRTVNINDAVLVKLTPEGWRLHRLWHEQLFGTGQYARRAAGGVVKRWQEYVPPESDEQGRCMFRLWELAQVFGQHLYNGCDLPFETELELVDRLVDRLG